MLGWLSIKSLYEAVSIEILNKEVVSISNNVKDGTKKLIDSFLTGTRSVTICIVFLKISDASSIDK